MIKYFVASILIAVWILFSYSQSGISSDTEQIQFTRKAQKYMEQEIEKYIKKCDDGYYYFASQKHGEKKLTLERVENYQIKVIDSDTLLNERFGYFETNNLQLLDNNKWKDIYPEWRNEFPLQVISYIKSDSTLKFSIFNPFESVLNIDYILGEDFQCPNVK